MEFKQRLVEVFAELFGKNNDGSGENYFASKWGWYISIDAVASNDITKHEFVYKLSIFQFLTHLEYLKDKNTEEIRLMKVKK